MDQRRRLILIAILSSAMAWHAAGVAADDDAPNLGSIVLAARVGLWQVTSDNRPPGKKGPIPFPGTHRLFAYDGRTVTLTLLTEKAWMWRSEDDVYRLKAKWEGPKLYYLPPFATWQYLATFQDDRFFVEDEKRQHRWEYERMRKEDLAQPDRALAKERAVHDYGIKPTDPVIPEHLRRFPGLYVRAAGEIVDAPAADVALARSYPSFADKGPIEKGLRLTIMTANKVVTVNQEVRVVHVLEAVEPGHEVYVMGPKVVYEEYVDGQLATQKWSGPGIYDGAVMKSPWADYNYDITSYRFAKPGRHTIQWQGGDPSEESVGLNSNVLVIEVR